MLKPSDVFTPGKIPLGETTVYAQRGKSERDFGKYLARGQIPIVFGGYGVGKTSLARHNLLQVEAEGRLVNIPSVAGLTVKDVLQHALETLGYTVARSATHEVTDSSGVKISSSLGIDAPLKASTSVELNTASSIKRSEVRELVVESPTDVRIIKICDEHRLVFLLDEMHAASAEFLADLTRFLKAYKNMNGEGLRVVLLGTASDSDRLVLRDPGIDRLMQEVELGPMTSEEANYVITKGMQDLCITYDDEVRERIVRASAGAPNTIQSLCLEIAEMVFDLTPRHATVEHYRTALREFSQSRLRRQQERYHRAIEHTGVKRYRRRILHAMAATEDEYVTMDQIREKVSEYLGEQVPNTALSGPLRELKQEAYGSILQDLQRTEFDRVYNLTNFSDPAMKHYIQMLQSGEFDGIVEDADPNA